MPRFRKSSVWDLRADDVIRYRSPEGTFSGRILGLEHNPATGHVFGLLVDRDGNTRQFRFRTDDRVQRRLLTCAEMIAEVTHDVEGGAPVSGYQLQVGRRHQVFWLHRDGNRYQIKAEKPGQPPLADFRQVQDACAWVRQTYPRAETRAEPVHRAGGSQPLPRQLAPIGHRAVGA